MKKLLSILLVCFMLAGIMALPASADDISVFLDGTQLSFDVPPQIINDRTYVPMRAIFEALGYTVTWKNSWHNITAVKGNDTIYMDIDDSRLELNNIRIYFDGAATIVNDRTLVPIRAVSAASGCDVSWDGAVRKVNITHNANKTDPGQSYTGAKPAFIDKMALPDGCGTMQYDVDFDGKMDSIELRQIRSFDNSPYGDLNCLKTELIINGTSFIIDNAYKTHGCGALFVGDIDQKDNYLDIIMLMSYKSTSALVFQYRNGMLYEGSVPVGGFGEVITPEYAEASVNDTSWQTSGFTIFYEGKQFHYEKTDDCTYEER